MVSFPLVSPARPYTPPSHPYALHARPISFCSILSPAQYWVGSTNHLAPRYAISSIPPVTSSVLGPNIPLNTCSQTPSASFPLAIYMRNEKGFFNEGKKISQDKENQERVGYTAEIDTIRNWTDCSLNWSNWPSIMKRQRKIKGYALSSQLQNLLNLDDL